LTIHSPFVAAGAPHRLCFSNPRRRRVRAGEFESRALRRMFGHRCDAMANDHQRRDRVLDLRRRRFGHGVETDLVRIRLCFEVAGRAVKRGAEDEWTGATAMTRKAAAALLSCLVLGGCTGGDARTRLAQDLPNVENFELVHARFPCFSPDFHFYGYRFRVRTKADWSFGDICWNFATRQWTWVILPGYELSHLTPTTR
jgi:hypothetical protein